MNDNGEIRRLGTGEKARINEILLSERDAVRLAAATQEVRKDFYKQTIEQRNREIEATLRGPRGKNSADRKRLRRVGRL